MLGYVVPCKSELKLREFEIYNAYYCAICHSIRDRYGQLPRLLLSYDAVFLAMMLSAPSETADEITTFRCVTHPGKKRNIAVCTREIDYAADMMLLLGYFNLKDDREDEGTPLGYAGEWFLRGAYRKIRGRMPEKAERIAACLGEMRALERERTDSLDRIAEPFANLMSEVMDYTGLADIRPAEDSGLSDGDYTRSLRSAYRRVGYHLGKWIYLIDAIDDLEDDKKHDSYNPLRYMDDGAAPAERLKLNLLLYLAEIAEVMELLPLRKNAPILENIVYVGLNRRTEEILNKLEFQDTQHIG
jgi:hypothetical protein